MSSSPSLDRLIKNVQVVSPNSDNIQNIDIGIADGKFVRLEADIDAADAKEVVDGKSQLAFPGLVDAHTHMGIYSPLAEDAQTESKAAAMGGVTSMLNYFRTGHVLGRNSTAHVSASLCLGGV